MEYIAENPFEIGRVLTSVLPVAEMQQEIARAVYPERIRMVATAGTIDVNVETQEISQMDGPAFAIADILLQEVERQNFTFWLDGIGPVIGEFISDEIILLDMVRARWSERKMEAIAMYDELDSQKEVAETLGITEQAVQAISESRIRRRH